ncbi:MAG: hypothetical protein RLY21_2558 [Planctomycetota bacterium]|jgi:hypothetical protein
MTRTITPRRGNCLTGLVIGLAVLGFLLLVAGSIAYLSFSPSTALEKLQVDLKALVDSAAVIEAPGSVEVELAAGGAAFILSPSGEVGDKVIPAPPAGVTYTITVTDPGGNPVRFETNDAPRTGSEPFYLFGFCELKTEGPYTITVTASDGSTPAAILATRASQAELQRLLSESLRISGGVIGGCGAVCGLAIFVVFGVLALFMRKKSQPDPLAI